MRQRKQTFKGYSQEQLQDRLHWMFEKAGSATKLGEMLGCSHQHAANMLSGTRDVGPLALVRLGLKKINVYVEVSH